MSNHDSSEHAGSAAIVIVLGALALFLASPGAIVIFAVESILNIQLVPDQRWCFAIVCCLAVWIPLRIRSTASEAFTRYVWLAALTTAVTLVARFGLHAAWPREIWASFFG